MFRLIAAICIFFMSLPSIAQRTAATKEAPGAQTSNSEVDARLPVKRIALYKNGVGYFEHSAHIHGTQELNIDFTTAQLNDVLKSLTVVDLGEGHISGVRYNSIAPLDERLKALRLPFAENITRVGYLAALRGARVEVRSGVASVTGKLLSVETEQRTNVSGAVIAGARVTLRNEENGASQTTTTDANGHYQFYNIQGGNSALFASAPGFKRFDLTNVYLGTGRTNEINLKLEMGGVGSSASVEAALPQVQTSSASVSVSTLAGKQHVEAEGKDLGDYFEYNVKQPITIGKNQSALVPILQAHVEAEKVSIWNEESKEIRRGLWLNNSSGLTLDSGTFNILDGDTFAGEGIIETLHPAERRLISYAADPALRISLDEESNQKPATHVRIAKGVMVLTREQRDSRTYTLHNSDAQPRQVVIEHPSREGWKLAEGAKPEETSASFLRFRVGVGPGKTENLKIEEFHPEQTEYELSELDDDQVKLISEQPLTPAVRDIFRKVLDQKNQVNGIETQIGIRQQEVDSISKDQARVRENMKALKGSSEERTLLQRYTKQLDSQEDRLGALNKEISDLQDKKSKVEDQFDQILQQVVMDESL